MGIISDGNKYGIAEDLIYSFPVKCKNGKCEIVEGLPISDFAKTMMKISESKLETYK